MERMEKLFQLSNLKYHLLQLNRKWLNTRIEQKKGEIKEVEEKIPKLYKELVALMDITDEDLLIMYNATNKRIEELEEELDWKWSS